MFRKNIITTLFALFFFTTLSAQEAESEAMNEKIKGKIQICVSCHGEQGATIMPVYPILAGQNFYYAYVQLKDLKSGLRKNEIMAAMVQDLDKDEMKLLAGHFSEQTWPETKHKSDAGKTDIAKMAIDAGQCVQCHRGGFEGESYADIETTKKTVGLVPAETRGCRDYGLVGGPVDAGLREQCGEVDF